MRVKPPMPSRSAGASERRQFVIDTVSTATYTRAVGGAFDGAGPGEPSGPSWRGVIGMLIGILVVLLLIGGAVFLAVSNPGTPTP